MRYLIALWVVIATSFIPAGQLQAADVVAQPQELVVVNPIMPIEPSADAPRAGFWQKTKQDLRFLRKQLQRKPKKRGEVEPINEDWYGVMAAVTVIEGAIYALGSFLGMFLGLLAFASGGTGLGLILGLIGMATLIFIVFYAIKLVGASNGDEEKFLKGKRFLLGYITFGLIVAFWLTLVLALIYEMRWDWGGSYLSPVDVVIGLLIGILFAAPILVFNIIDHNRHKKARKEQQNKQ